MTDQNNTPGNDMPDPPAESIPEQRNEPRLRVHWDVAAIWGGLAPCHGFVGDISSVGATVYLDRNPLNVKSATFLIQVPPLKEEDATRAIEVDGKIIQTLHDSTEMMFRAGIQFGKFRDETDAAYLARRIHR